jgi:hypothetical protein
MSPPAPHVRRWTVYIAFWPTCKAKLDRKSPVGGPFGDFARDHDRNAIQLMGTKHYGSGFFPSGIAPKRAVLPRPDGHSVRRAQTALAGRRRCHRTLDAPGPTPAGQGCSVPPPMAHAAVVLPVSALSPSRPKIIPTAARVAGLPCRVWVCARRLWVNTTCIAFLSSHGKDAVSP